MSDDPVALLCRVQRLETSLRNIRRAVSRFRDVDISISTALDLIDCAAWEALDHPPVQPYIISPLGG